MEKDRILTIRTASNGVSSKSENRRTTIVRSETGQTHLIQFKSLTAESGVDSACETILTANDKIKITSVGLSTLGLLQLHETLKQYVSKINMEV